MALLVPPSLFLPRAPRGLSTSLDLLPLSMIYILFCLLLFIAVFITSSSVHLTALRVFLPSQSAHYRASSLPLLHLKGNERSAAYLAFNAFTQFASSACHWLVSWSSVPLHNYISTLCMACLLDCTTWVFLWFNVFGFASLYEISLPLIPLTQELLYYCSQLVSIGRWVDSFFSERAIFLLSRVNKGENGPNFR